MRVSRAAVVLDPSADAFAGSQASRVVDRGFYGRDLFFVVAHVGTIGETGRYTIKAQLCLLDGTSPLDVEFEYWLADGIGDGFAAPVLAPATGYTVPAAPTQTIVVHVLPEVVPDSDLPGVRLKFDETVNEPVIGCVVAYCANPVQGGDSVRTMTLN